MTDLSKVKIAFILFNSNFWMATIVLYLQTRLQDYTSVFQLITFYYLFTTILEYPTGVIGDYFSHKISVLIGYLLLSITMLALSFPGSFLFYVAVLFLGGLGMSLVSGSDQAYLSIFTNDFKNEFSHLVFIYTIWSVTTITFGGLLGKFNLIYPLLANAISFFLAGFFLFISHQKTFVKNDGNIFKESLTGLNKIINDKTVFYLICLGGLFGLFFISLKWLYNPQFIALNIGVGWWGILIGISTLLTALGSKLSNKINPPKLTMLFFIFIISLILMGLTQFALISLMGLTILSLNRGLIQTHIDVSINQSTPLNIRARILSFKSLLIRLGATPFLFLTGYLLEIFSFQILMYFTAIIISLIYILITYKLNPINIKT